LDQETQIDLDGPLTDLEQALGEREAMSVSEVLSTVGKRGFGPILVLLATFLILPFGAIPGVPAVVAIFIALIALEMVLGGKVLRLPRKLREISLNGDRIRAFLRHARPMGQRLGRLFRPRFIDLAASQFAYLFIASALFFTAIIMFFVGFIPGLPFLLAWPILLFGLGLTARDGGAIMAGITLFLMPMGALISWLFG
jgi:hypothetical protein